MREAIKTASANEESSSSAQIFATPSRADN